MVFVKQRIVSLDKQPLTLQQQVQHSIIGLQDTYSQVTHSSFYSLSHKDISNLSILSIFSGFDGFFSTQPKIQTQTLQIVGLNAYNQQESAAFPPSSLHTSDYARFKVNGT